MAHIVRTRIQMRFSDVDMFRHVNTSAQQTYYDAGKTDYYCQTLGDGLFSDNLRVVMVAISTSFIDQIRPEDSVWVETSTEKVGRKSLTLYQRIVDQMGTLKGESRSVMVAFDFAEQCAVEVPEAWRTALLAE